MLLPSSSLKNLAVNHCSICFSQGLEDSYWLLNSCEENSLLYIPARWPSTRMFIALKNGFDVVFQIFLDETGVMEIQVWKICFLAAQPHATFLSSASHWKMSQKIRRRPLTGCTNVSVKRYNRNMRCAEIEEIYFFHYYQDKLIDIYLKEGKFPATWSSPYVRGPIRSHYRPRRLHLLLVTLVSGYFTLPLVARGIYSLLTSGVFSITLVAIIVALVYFALQKMLELSTVSKGSSYGSDSPTKEAKDA